MVKHIYMEATKDIIDRDSFQPAYLQLVQLLRDKISQGIFRPGDRLPSESQLCKQYQVSPMTVRRAINMLLEQGVVSTAQGRGTFVKQLELGGVTFGLDQLLGLFKDRESARIKILEAHIVRADARISEKLALPLGSRTIHIRRLFTQNGDPLIYHREYLIYDPTRPVVEDEMEVTSLFGLFSGSGASGVKWGRLTVSATTLTEDQAKLLKTAPGSPSFYLEHVFYDYDEKPLSWGGFYCRGDRFSFSTTVGLRTPKESGLSQNKGGNK